MRNLALALAAAVILAMGYGVFLRPWYQTWGATAAEIQAEWPGDDLWPRAAAVETRAVTIRAPAAEVWRWVAQIGQDKAGFYSYRVLENLVGCRMPDERRILGLPDPRPGDFLWMGPKDRWGGKARAEVALVVPGRSIVHRTNGWAGDEAGGIWAFHVVPNGERTTRFVVRGRAGVLGKPPSAGERLLETLVLEPAHFAMERRMMLGVKELAEGRGIPPWEDAAEVLLWAGVLLAGVAAAIGIGARRRRAWSLAAVAIGAASLLAVLVFARPPLLASAVGVAGLVSWLIKVLRLPARA